MSKLSFRTKVLFTTVPILLAACSSFAETIKIGAIVPMTGPVAEDGAAVLKGAKLAVKLFNEAGGLGGDKIDLLVEERLMTKFSYLTESAL